MSSTNRPPKGIEVRDLADSIYSVLYIFVEIDFWHAKVTRKCPRGFLPYQLDETDQMRQSGAPGFVADLKITTF